MNLSQIMRKARFEVDAIRASGITSALWGDEEVIDAANTAMDAAARLIRLADSNLLTKALKSTGAVIDLVTEVYDPTVLQMRPGVVDILLPPDFVRVETIMTITAGYEDVKFYPATLTEKGWVDQSHLTQDDIATVVGGQQIFYYNIIGARTLRVRPINVDTFDIELNYQYRPARLQNYALGTVTTTSGSKNVTGSGMTWFTSGIREPADLCFMSPSAVMLNTVYPRLSAVTGETTATLARPWPSDTYTGNYHLSMLPTLPEEHHAWLAQMTAAIMLRKVSPELSEKSLIDLSKQFTDGVQPEVTIRQVQESIPVDEFNIP